MTCAQYEAVAVKPVRVLGIETKMSGPKCESHRSGTHRQSGMSTVCFLNGVNRKTSNGIDTKVFERWFSNSHSYKGTY